MGKLHARVAKSMRLGCTPVPAPRVSTLQTVEDKLRSEQQARLQTHLKEQQQQQQQSDAASAPTCTSASASSPVPAASDRADADQQPSTSHASLAPAPAASPAGPGPGSSSGPPPGAIPASAWGWGRSGGGPGGKGDGGDSGAWRLGGTDLTGLKDALHLAQVRPVCGCCMLAWRAGIHRQGTPGGGLDAPHNWWDRPGAVGPLYMGKVWRARQGAVSWGQGLCMRRNGRWESLAQDVLQRGMGTRGRASWAAARSPRAGEGEVLGLEPWGQELQPSG